MACISILERVASAQLCSTSYSRTANAENKGNARSLSSLRRVTAFRTSFPRCIVARSAHVSAEAEVDTGSARPSTKPTITTTALDRHAVRLRRKQRLQEQATYQAAAVAATAGIGALAVFATYYRIAWHLHHGEDFPYLELGATLLLVCGGIVGMEMYARWAHKALWHDAPLGWALHKSHHEPRMGPFEANDVFAIINAVPAMALCLYGFLRPDVVGGLCFGAGLGITLFGISYMFVHDGLVHKRFPVGPIAKLPALRRIAVAHKVHHSERFGGVPFGLFLGPQELEAVGAREELDRLVAAAAAGDPKE